MTRRLLLFTLAAVLVLAATAVASTTKTKSKTVSIAAGKTMTVIVPYPDALKHGGSKYKCSVKVLSGSVKTLSKGSAQGGSVCQAKLRNTGQGTAKAKVTATTIEP
jgi:hypothetical protein